MLNRVYRLIAPRLFEPVELEIGYQPAMALVRPTYLSICNADQRYYQGKRSADALAKKLPMALIHEGIGRLCYDPTDTFERGSRIIMLPNNPVEEDAYIAENYLSSSKFCGSGYDGFMQEFVALPVNRLMVLPDQVGNDIGSFTEIISVAVHAVTRFESIAHGRRNTIGVWGDGNMGFIVSLVLRVLYPDACIVVIGRNQYKLDEFTFVDATYLAYDIGRVPAVDHAFECCGGDGSTSAIEQIIDRIKPEGALSLLGVSEDRVPINTRMVLEKGLRLFGSSRSGRVDFQRTLALYNEHPQMLSYLNSLVGNVLTVSTTADAAHAFEVDLRKNMGKTILKWDV